MWKLGLEAAQFPEKEYINGIAVAVRTKTSYSLLFSMEPHSLISKSTKYTQNTKGKPFIFRIFSFFRLWLLSVPYTDRAVYSDWSPLLFSFELGAYCTVYYSALGPRYAPLDCTHPSFKAHYFAIQGAPPTSTSPSPSPPRLWQLRFSSLLLTQCILCMKRLDRSFLHPLVNHPEKITVTKKLR